MKLLCTILATALAVALSASAKTFDWPIDSPAAGARQFTAYHGETVRFNLQFKGAMTNLSPVAIYYQTNGMGKAEWFEPVPGTVFHPTNDCGAAFYRFFIRCTDPDGINYTANGSLRLLDSPGFEPSAIQLPVQTLDFSRIEIVNPPWGEGGGTPGNYAAVSNAAMNAISRAEAEAGFTEWRPFGSSPGYSLISATYNNGQWTIVVLIDGASGPTTYVFFGSPTETEIPFSRYYTSIIRTRLPTMADIPTKTSDLTNNSGFLTQHQQLVPVTKWIVEGLCTGWYVSSGPSWTGSIWTLTIEDGTTGEIKADQDSPEDAKTLNFGGGITASLSVIGYTLGDQTNKVLASTNGLARASDVADARAVADAAASTNATHGAALSQLSQRTNDWNAAAQNASDALAYSRATYNFQQGNTNTWFSGTNFVFGADATNKTAFAFEPGMDLMTMPCSLALMEIRDGLTQKVWDQRDWTVWYWNFKNAQYEATVAERLSAAAAFNATNYAPIAWGRRTSSGRANPDSKTLWVDAEKTVLAPGMAWESTVEVEGCAYWTIVGSATLSGNTNGVISILDFEGNPVFRIRKTASHLVTLETGSEIYTSGWDAQGRITYTMRASVHPVGVFSTVLDDSLFVDETNAGCPVDYEWETLEQPSANSPGVYRIHFLLKPGISSDGCFAKFKVEVQGETAVEFIAVQKITGGQVYDDGTHGDVKIRPVITSTAVGSVVTWEVAP